jgi:hypothetical protein
MLFKHLASGDPGGSRADDGYLALVVSHSG